MITNRMGHRTFELESKSSKPHMYIQIPECDFINYCQNHHHEISSNFRKGKSHHVNLISTTIRIELHGFRKWINIYSKNSGSTISLKEYTFKKFKRILCLFNNSMKTRSRFYPENTPMLVSNDEMMEVRQSMLEPLTGQQLKVFRTYPDEKEYFTEIGAIRHIQRQDADQSTSMLKTYYEDPFTENKLRKSSLLLAIIGYLIEHIGEMPQDYIVSSIFNGVLTILGFPEQPHQHVLNAISMDDIHSFELKPCYVALLEEFFEMNADIIAKEHEQNETTKTDEQNETTKTDEQNETTKIDEQNETTKTDEQNETKKNED